VLHVCRQRLWHGIEVGGLDQRIHDGSPLAAAICTREKPVLPTDTKCGRLDKPLPSRGVKQFTARAKGSEAVMARQAGFWDYEAHLARLTRVAIRW
jgi:hypothetical protein